MAILTLGMQGVSAKGIDNEEILSRVSQYDSYTREVRRHLHLYPEVGGHEVETAKYLKAELAKIGKFEAWNVIPDSVYVGGTLRFFDWDAGVRAVELFKNVATDVAHAHGCNVRFTEKMAAQVPPVVNDPQATAVARRLIGELYPGRVTDDAKYNWWASETFALYNQLAQTLFTFVGVQNPDLGTTAVHHTAEFDIDEDALQYAIGTMVKFAIGY